MSSTFNIFQKISITNVFKKILIFQHFLENVPPFKKIVSKLRFPKKKIPFFTMFQKMFHIIESDNEMISYFTEFLVDYRLIEVIFFPPHPLNNIF